MSILHQHDKWTVVAPIDHLVLSDAINHEFRIDRVTLVATAKLPGRRRRFGIPWRVSEMRSEKHGVFKQVLDLTPAVGIIRATGNARNLERDITRLVRDELAILEASQLGYAKRAFAGAPAIWREKPVTQQSLLWIGRSKTWEQPNRTYGPLLPLHLDAQWHRFQQQLFFYDLLKLLRGETKIAKSWRQDLRRAAVLVGLSQTSNSLPDAFLWNMVALELLLTCQGDKVIDDLPSRAEALLGWSRNWTEDNFEAKIRQAYLHRCLLVHQGDRDSPTREDLFFTDDLLFCLLSNLVTHPILFCSKQAVIEFSKRVEAERLLKGIKTTVRPRSLRMFRRKYNPKDYDVY